MSEDPPVYHTTPDADAPPEIARDPQFVARLDAAALHAWVTAATAVLQELLAASQIPADWPRERQWVPTVQLYPTYRARITALLAGNLPPDPLVGEVNRLCGLLTEAHAERDALKAQAAAVTRHLPLRVGGTLTAGLFDAVTALDGAMDQALSATQHAGTPRPAPQVADDAAQREIANLRTQIAALATERDQWQTRALSAERIANVPPVAKGVG